MFVDGDQNRPIVDPVEIEAFLHHRVNAFLLHFLDYRMDGHLFRQIAIGPLDRPIKHYDERAFSHLLRVQDGAMGEDRPILL